MMVNKLCTLLRNVEGEKYDISFWVVYFCVDTSLKWMKDVSAAELTPIPKYVYRLRALNLLPGCCLPGENTDVPADITQVNTGWLLIWLCKLHHGPCAQQVGITNK